MIITLKGANFASSNIGTLDSWLISKSLTGVTIDNTATSVKKGEAYKAVITLKENYTFPDTITVTMAGTDITSTYVTKTATTITINIPSVTGNIVIRVNATSNVVGVTYSITRTLTALTAGSNVNTITSGDTYEETFSIPKDMYDGWAGASGVEVDLTVKMGGSTLAPNTGAFTAELVYQQVSGVERATGFKVTVPNVSGNIAITATSYVPFNESIADTKVYHYTEKDKSIDIDGVSIGDVLIYANVSGAKVHGWKIPAGAKLTVTYKNTKAILYSEAMVLLHKTSNNVLDYKSTFIATAGEGSTSTFTFTNVYNDEILLEANEGVIVSGRYTVVGGGITPDKGEQPTAVNLWKYASSDMDAIMTNARYRLTNGLPYKEEGDPYDKTYGTTEKIYVNGNSGTYTLDLESGKTYRWQFIPYFEYGFLKLHNPWGGNVQTSMVGKRIFFYRADDTLIENDTKCLDETGMLVTVPQDAVYMRFMSWGYGAHKDKVKPLYDTLMITEGETEYTEYIPAS